MRADLIKLIETAITYKLGRLSREEIQTMLQVHDIRETRVYQEAKEEGMKEGIALAIVKMAAKNLPAEEIAQILEVDMELVRQVLKSRTNG